MPDAKTTSSSSGRTAAIRRAASRADQVLRAAGFAAALAGTGLMGCVHPPGSASAAARIGTRLNSAGASPVPAIAPNYLPDSLFNALGTVRRDSEAVVSMVRSIVKVTFKDSANQRDRQQAVDLIDGVVVGGLLLDTDGEYFVRIPGSTYADIQAAVRKLRALPQVNYAFPLLLGKFGPG